MTEVNKNRKVRPQQTLGLSRFLFAGHKKVSAFIFNKYYVNKEKVLRIPKIPLFTAVYHCKIVCLLDDLKNFTINLVVIAFWLILIDRAWRQLRQ